MRYGLEGHIAFEATLSNSLASSVHELEDRPMLLREFLQHTETCLEHRHVIDPSADM